VGGVGGCGGCGGCRVCRVCGVCGVCVGVWGCWGCGGPAHSLRSTFHRLHLLRLWTPTIFTNTMAIVWEQVQIGPLHCPIEETILPHEMTTNPDFRLHCQSSQFNDCSGLFFLFLHLTFDKIQLNRAY
jgi:hypothetical protein